MAWGTVVALFIAGGLRLLLARSIAAPVQQMQVVAGRLAAGRLSERVSVQTRDELGDLARSLKLHGQRARTDRLDAPGLRGRLDLTTVSPSDLLQRAVRPFRLRAEQTHIVLELDLPPRLPPVRADADRTIQVLTNLLDNAFKHTPRGGTVRVAGAERRGHVLLSVADSGPGIPEAEVPHIFDRFYKVDKARIGGRGGAGLGLAIARRLVEAQGGIIIAVTLPKES